MKERQKPEEENALKNEEPSDENQPKGADDNGAAEEQTPEFLLRTLESVRKERDDYYDLLLRKQAEFDNYRKRTLRDREEARVGALMEMSKELLPVLDAAEKGLAALSADTCDPKLAGYRQGYELLLRNLRSMLEKFGVKELPALGEKFDPSVHEAVITEATDEHEEGRVLAEYRKGYTISDRLLRPAQVKVAVPTPVDSD
ncbi:MAG: nucleotide exchange factor GrpE [Acidobacteria bacterium]|nr:MAG: nucleotide exchange factor GrpE [Acidobacteriota bacterium]